MTRRILYILLCLSFSLFADFEWDGLDYHNHSESQRSAAMNVLQRVFVEENDTILDAGCGDGKISKVLADLVPRGHVIGIDLSPSQIAFAKQMERDNLKFAVADMQYLPFENQFDLITTFNAIQWVPDQPKTYRSMYNALKPGGILVATIPFGMTWQLSEAVREVINRDHWKEYPFHDKQYFYLRETYAAFLRDAGFRISQYDIISSPNRFPDRDSFTAFVRQWLPFIHDVPTELRDCFMEEVMDVYEEILPPLETGEILFDKYNCHIIVEKQ